MSSDENEREQEDDKAPRRDPNKMDRISQSLKRAYDDVANEPLPDHLTELLEKLRKGGAS